MASAGVNSPINVYDVIASIVAAIVVPTANYCQRMEIASFTSISVGIWIPIKIVKRIFCLRNLFQRNDKHSQQPFNFKSRGFLNRPMFSKYELIDDWASILFSFFLSGIKKRVICRSRDWYHFAELSSCQVQLVSICWFGSLSHFGRLHRPTGLETARKFWSWTLDN